MTAHLFDAGSFPFCTASGKLPDPRRGVGIAFTVCKEDKKSGSRESGFRFLRVQKFRIGDFSMGERAACGREGTFGGTG